ncbi:Histone-lysine N-methyltransferase setd3 [Blastocladiella emersonii ATCC 22665]|nr:Histone-lysine N-methyltransferase setd3 [Blastocladiella emersonii ATCC 22665]
MAPRNTDRREDYINTLVPVLDKIRTCTQLSLPYGAKAEVEWQYFEEIHELQVELMETQAKAAAKYGKQRAGSASAVAPRSALPLGERLSKFKKWLVANGVSKDAPVEFKANLHEGVGAVATRDVAKDEEVLRIPRSLVMSTMSAQRSPRIRDFLTADRQVNGLPAAVILVVHLLEHKFDPTSFYKPYLDVLPDAFALPYFFDPEDLAELKGSSVLREVYVQLCDMLRTYALIFDAVEKSKIVSIWNFTWVEWRWAMAVVHTRQNVIPAYTKAEADEWVAAGRQLSSLPRTTTCLIPGWDMINHREGLPITSTNDYDVGDHVFLAPEPVRRGHQVYMGYTDNRPNRHRLMRSAFLAPKPVPADYLQVPFSFPKVKDAQRRKHLALTKFKLQEPFPLDLRAPIADNYDNVIGTLAAAFGTAEDLKRIEQLPSLVQDQTLYPTLQKNQKAMAEAYTAGELECRAKIANYIKMQAMVYLTRNEEDAETYRAQLDELVAAGTASAVDPVKAQMRINVLQFRLFELETAKTLLAHAEEEAQS